MLVELRVRDLGVIAELELVLGPGMTVLTGETGAGKTLLVEAVELLVGGRAEGVLVRPGAEEATVEGRFAQGATETVLSRVVPHAGRSRAYVDGRMAPVGALAEAGRELVDLHGQHTHQSLLGQAAQRALLDAFGAVDVGEREQARARLADVDAQLAGLGGDARTRARELDVLRFQAAELESAAVEDRGEDERLEVEEDALAAASAHRGAAAGASAALGDDGGAGDAIGTALAAVGGRAPLAEMEDRLRAVAADVADLTAELRAAAERLQDDPERLEQVRARRRLLRDLTRKYGPTLEEVIAFAAEVRGHRELLESHDERAAALEQERGRAVADLRAAERALGAARRAAAPGLAAAVESHLQELAMPRARFEVHVGDDPGEDVSFLLGANPGEPALALSKIASGGELARTMLAARLVLSRGGPAGGPSTLVFDEVDAGIGGAAALAVGRSLAALAADRQVLVVTHLPQVAAFADRQVAVTKAEENGRTRARAAPLGRDERVIELSRMLSGRPESRTARGHAEELLAAAARERGR
jgi:DNA repair protein RecN (Recombination protein N)